MHAKRLLPLLLFPLLAACEQIGELLELPNPQREAAMAEAEGRAVGAACRYSGRSLEDCFVLNPSAQKAAVFGGWREMNDYMMEHSMEVVPSRLPQPNQLQPRAFIESYAEPERIDGASATDAASPPRRPRAGH